MTTFPNFWGHTLKSSRSTLQTCSTQACASSRCTLVRSFLLRVQLSPKGVGTRSYLGAPAIGLTFLLGKNEAQYCEVSSYLTWVMLFFHLSGFFSIRVTLCSTLGKPISTHPQSHWVKDSCVPYGCSCMCLTCPRAHSSAFSQAGLRNDPWVRLKTQDSPPPSPNVQ